MPTTVDYSHEAQKIWKSLLPLVRGEIQTNTKNCVRAKQMKVITAPNGRTVGVREPYANKVFDLPYSSALTLNVGDPVIVYWYFGNASTMIVMAKGDGQFVT